MTKPKVALYWCASCGGCEESVVDLAADILKVIEAVDIVFWPVAMDFKYSDVEAMEDGEITCTLINGAIRTEEQERIAKLLRRKSKVIIAHGSCAHLGGVVGLGNFYSRTDLMDRAYKDAPTMNNPSGTMPQTKFSDGKFDLTLPEFHDTVRSLDQVIDVEYYIPGCPPTPELIFTAITALLEGKLPPVGSVIASDKALCDECKRKDTKPEKPNIKGFKRVYEVDINSERCFLDQGVICLGPATRGGCGERCIGANFPCRGCFGPLDNVDDQGTKSLSFLGSIIDSNDEDEIKRIAETIPDLSGLIYRYGLAASKLGKKKGR